MGNCRLFPACSQRNMRTHTPWTVTRLKSSRHVHTRRKEEVQMLQRGYIINNRETSDDRHQEECVCTISMNLTLLNRQIWVHSSNYFFLLNTVEVKSLHSPFSICKISKIRGIIQNVCYCLFSTDLNKIFHIKDVYM